MFASLDSRASIPVLASLLLLGGGACTPAGESSGVDTGADPALGGDAANPDADTSGEPGGLHITASTTGALCAGTCVDLEASWPGAHQDYVFAWNQALNGAGPHRVCPRETTTYTVDASAAPGEFTNSSHAELTVSVRACDDAGVGPDDGGSELDDAGQSTAKHEVVCRQRFRYSEQDSAGWYNAEGNQGISNDPQGNTVVTGVFRGELAWDGGSLTSTPTADFSFNHFVIKLDAMCNVLWGRALSTSTGGQWAAIAQQFDSDQITLLVSQRPKVRDLEYFNDELWPYLLRLNASGQELWRTYVGSDYRDERGVIGTLAVDAVGNVAMTGSMTDKVGPFFIDPASYLLRFDALGNPRGEDIMENPREALQVTTDAAGQIALAGWVGGHFAVGGGTSTDGTGGMGLTMLDAKGSYRWDRVLSPTYGGSVAALVTRGRPGHLLVAYFGAPVEAGFISVEDWTTDGQNVWKASYPYPIGVSPVLVRAAPNGRVFFLTNYRKTLDFGGKVFSRADELSQLVYGSFDADGKLRYVAEVPAVTLESYPAAIGVDAQNRPVVLSYGQNDASSPRGDLVLTKLSD